MTEKIYRIGGMDCANCAREVQEGVSRLKGVRDVRVDFITEKMTLDGDVPFDTLKKRVEALGKTLADPDDADHEHEAEDGHHHQDAASGPTTGGVIGFVRYLANEQETRLALIGGGIILATLVLTLMGLPGNSANLIYIVATAIALAPIARSGLKTLFINHDFNINLLMTIAAIGAILIGDTLEAATVVFLFAVGEALEGFTSDRARNSLRGLMELAPATAIRILSSEFQVLSQNSKQPAAQFEEVVPVESLKVGDTILVNPGERVAMDGEVLSGESGVNQAPITGESMPVRKSVGAEVFAGSINGDGALTLKVTRLAADNTLSRIIRMVEEAQSVRAPSQRMIDKFARWYTPGIVIIATLVALVPPLLFKAPFYNPGDGTQGWLYRALELLVIACPCSLVISTPVTIISAITAAARRGVLIKGGAHLESLAEVKAIAFDKTGTLTHGRPAVTNIRSVDCPTGEQCEKCDDVLALASSVEKRSTHPLAKSVVQAAQERGLDTVYAPAEKVETLAGRGVQGQVNGKLVTIGSHNLFDAQYPHSTELCDLVRKEEAQGQTTMLLSEGDRVRGYIALADEVRPDSRDAIRDLRALGVQTVMLTGDNSAVAQAVGKAVGVNDVRAELLPADKVDAVNSLLREYGTVGMVGDGVNDTPALAAATVGVAMGGAGSGQALETADIALMADDLKQLPYAIELARFARRLIRQNITVSLGLKLAFMLLALAGGASLWLAVFADVGMSLIVTTNGMRPLRFRR
ncbi:MAG: cation-translocating P-type ATPase [Chloroflexota bacterium]